MEDPRLEGKRFASKGLERTGFTYTMRVLRGKYKLPVIYCLMIDGPTRYNELRRKLEGPTFQSLTNALRELEADGIVERRDYQTVPPHVEYALTEKGASMIDFLLPFCEWGSAHGE